MWKDARTVIGKGEPPGTIGVAESPRLRLAEAPLQSGAETSGLRQPVGPVGMVRDVDGEGLTKQDPAIRGEPVVFVAARAVDKYLLDDPRHQRALLLVGQRRLGGEIVLPSAPFQPLGGAEVVLPRDMLQRLGAEVALPPHRDNRSGDNRANGEGTQHGHDGEQVPTTPGLRTARERRELLAHQLGGPINRIHRVRHLGIRVSGRTLHEPPDPVIDLQHGGDDPERHHAGGDLDDKRRAAILARVHGSFGSLQLCQQRLCQPRQLSIDQGEHLHFSLLLRSAPLQSARDVRTIKAGSIGPIAPWGRSATVGIEPTRSDCQITDSHSEPAGSGRGARLNCWNVDPRVSH